jgi:hypothetical protein
MASALPGELVGAARVSKRILVDQGWLRSARAGVPVDRAGRAVPWYTFAAIAYLDQLDFEGRRVFEYGSGNSTIWWLSKGAEVTSVENDPAWYERLARSVEGPSMHYRLEPERASYVGAILEGGPFDVVVVDGFWRGYCVDAALGQLAPGGMIIIDNCDWLPAEASKLRAAGLLQVDFHGLVPLSDVTETTSIFFRRDAAFRATGDLQPVPPVGSWTPPPWHRRWLLEDPSETPEGGPPTGG